MVNLEEEIIRINAIFSGSNNTLKLEWLQKWFEEDGLTLDNLPNFVVNLNKEQDNGFSVVLVANHNATLMNMVYITQTINRLGRKSGTLQERSVFYVQTTKTEWMNIFF